MHGRHRSPGYRGLGFGARISPDTSLRANRRFQPPRRADIFVEAGRLAAQYLVSQGLLPPNVLSSKRLPDAQDGRTSALARLGRRSFAVAVGGDEGRRRGPSYRPSFHRFDRFNDADDDHNNNNKSLPNEPPRHFSPDMDSNPTSSETTTHTSADDLRDLTMVDQAQSTQTQIQKEDTAMETSNSNSNSNSMSINTTDLLSSLTLCNFAKVPTRIRSSLTSKSPKLDPIPATEVHPASATSSQTKIQVLVDSNSSENVAELGPASDHERELSQGPLENQRGEKRALELEDSVMQEEGAKRPRDWPPSVVMDADGCFNLSNLTEKNVASHEDGASSGPGDRVIMAVDHDNSMVNNSQFSKDGGEPEPPLDFSQEKQLFPSSFKICDLNLMQVSETHENHDSDPIIIYPALSEMKREAPPVDIDLSISNSNVSGENSRPPVDSKEIEVIDLENDSAQEDKDLVIEDTKTETVYTTDLEGFSNHAQNTGDIPDVQDGYGLMISELLGNDFPNCSSVPEHINPMHNDIGLHNEEGPLGDDDSIYMSLGEIPLTFLRPWEQPPPQEYEKPF